MEKIKRAFGSGGSKDDEIMYGTPSQVSDQPPQLQTDADTAAADKENSGILGPVLSTGDEKPSEQSYGTTTQSTEVPQSSSEPVGEGVQRSTEPVTETVQQPSDTQSKTTETEQEPSKSSKGILGRIFKSGDKKESGQGNEATPEATSSATKEYDSAPPEPSKVYNATEDQSQGDSNLGRDAAIGGVAATGVAGATYAATRDDGNDAERGLQRENHGDDVSQATYTARSYPLTSSAAHTSTPREPQVDSSLDRREPEEQSSTARDTSLAGAGTIIGAGAVGAGALAAQEDKHNDPEVEQATYTDRAIPVGSSSGTQEGIAPAAAKQEETQPNVGSASELTGHMPGEYPTETGEDPHVPGGFPADSTEEEKPSVGSGAAVPTAMGLGVLGAAGGGAYAASKSDNTTTAAEASKATESDLHPGGSGFPYESSKTAEPTSDSNLGRDAAIAGGTAAAVAGAGGLTYAATHGDDKPAEAAPTQKFEDTTAAPTSSTTESKPAETTTRSVDEQPTAATATTTEEKAEEQKPEEEDSHLGRDAAIAGGATAAAGAGAAYYATRDDDEPEQTEEKKGFFGKLKEKKQERDQKKEEEKAEKEREKAEKERQKEQEKAEKERQKEQERLEKERQKEAEKPEESNVGRDAAIAGTGAAAAGGAAYYATRDDDAEKAEKEREEAEKQRAKDQEQAEKERQKEHEKAEKERQKEQEKAEKEREKHQKEAEKEREKDEKKREKEMTKEEKKEEERRKKEAWEKENAARLAAYQRGELGPQDVLKDGQEQQPIADKSKEEAVEGGVLATGVIGGGAAATYAATRGEEQPTASSSEHQTTTDDQGHNVLHKKSEDSGQSSEKKPSLIQKILHPNKTRRASQDQGRTSSEAARSSQERSSQDFVAHKGHVGTDGPIGDSSKVSGLESGQEASKDVAPTTEGTATTSAARDTGDEIQPAAPAGGVQTLAPGERAPEGYITLVRADSAPDDPHVIVG